MSEWCLEYDSWRPKEEKLRESLCTLGNGYIAIRGASEESNQMPGHYHGTYLGGGFNRAETFIEGKVIENEDLVNWPDFTCLTFRFKGENWFALENIEILKFKQELDMQHGILTRRIHFKLEGKETMLETKRFVSMANPHVVGIRWQLMPINWEGEIEIKSMIDGSVTNNGVARYSALTKKHLNVEESGLAFEDAIYLIARTRQSGIQMAITAKTEVQCNGIPLPLTRKNIFENEKIGQCLTVFCEKHKCVGIDKTVAIFTSRDFAISHPFLASKNLIQNTKSFNTLMGDHEHKWKFVWQRFNISLIDMPEESKILRLHIFHLLQTVSDNSIGRDVSVPARGLHGEAYRGHIFWDELFIFPFIYFRRPELTRSLLMYRFRRLYQSRILAKQEGYKGAMFPWQSGSDGREESQVIHLNPESGNWLSDNTHKQRHINGAIVYNIDKYFQATNDREFISTHGVEIILEIAKFWVSMARYSSIKKRFEILGVVGPDEFHTKYPDTERLGIDNNAYTNFMAAWCIMKGIQFLNMLPDSHKEELLESLDISHGDLVQWEYVSRHMFIPIQENGIISQFEGFEKLKDFDWNEYRKRYKNLQRLDRILEAEGDSVNHYKVNKQGDVVMLFYLFSATELEEVFNWLGYDFDPQTIPKNIDYYVNHSSSGSSLSRIVHAWVLARSDRKHAWQLFKEALRGDIIDVQGGTTSEGIHLGAMAGTVDIVQRCFTGIEIKNGILWFNPLLPQELKGIELVLRYRGHWLSVKLDHSHLKITVDRSWEPRGKLGFLEEVYEFHEGSVFNFSLKDTHVQKHLT